MRITLILLALLLAGCGTTQYNVEPSIPACQVQGKDSQGVRVFLPWRLMWVQCRKPRPIIEDITDGRIQ
jgi:hypothetical protein